MIRPRSRESRQLRHVLYCPQYTLAHQACSEVTTEVSAVAGTALLYRGIGQGQGHTVRQLQLDFLCLTEPGEGHQP